MADINTTQCLNGELKPGDIVLSTPVEDFPCLVGTVLEITKVGTPEHDAETENPTDGVHVNFLEAEYSPRRIAEIEEMLSALYNRTIKLEESILDDIIMEPESLFRITGFSKAAMDVILDSREGAEAFCKTAEHLYAPPHATPETLEQSEIPEPEQSDNSNSPELTKQLMKRLDSNLKAYLQNAVNHPDWDVTRMSNEIAAYAGAHYYMTEINNFSADELRYLLQFRDPLAVVGDKFHMAGMDDYSDVMWDIFDRQDALQGDYERISDSGYQRRDDNPTTAEKPSVLEQIRNATKEPKPPRRDTPARSKHEPEH